MILLDTCVLLWLAADSSKLSKTARDQLAHCDRILVATAQVDDLTLLTPDDLIHAYPDVRVAW